MLTLKIDIRAEASCKVDIPTRILRTKLLVHWPQNSKAWRSSKRVRCASSLRHLASKKIGDFLQQIQLILTPGKIEPHASIRVGAGKILALLSRGVSCTAINMYSAYCD